MRRIALKTTPRTTRPRTAVRLARRDIEHELSEARRELEEQRARATELEGWLQRAEAVAAEATADRWERAAERVSRTPVVEDGSLGQEMGVLRAQVDKVGRLHERFESDLEERISELADAEARVEEAGSQDLRRRLEEAEAELASLRAQQQQPGDDELRRRLEEAEAEANAAASMRWELASLRMQVEGRRGSETLRDAVNELRVQRSVAEELTRSLDDAEYELEQERQRVRTLTDELRAGRPSFSWSSI
jgi:ABC-type transporter Mla subunit MlaD